MIDLKRNVVSTPELIFGRINFQRNVIQAPELIAGRINLQDREELTRNVLGKGDLHD